uniref:Uncharacterized protein n=2 Tax=unclassified Caudoviricetes TaxID=2788787 RepID=A0A8S5PJY9_9CAUD|nr:MAG TPA: hypothetical protein [Siphoviridae sp. ctOSJ35]DAE15978.1 MAG TPA: hypothetical protein [Siphoviridae sp. ctIOF8]
MSIFIYFIVNLLSLKFIIRFNAQDWHIIRLSVSLLV